MLHWPIQQRRTNASACSCCMLKMCTGLVLFQVYTMSPNQPCLPETCSASYALAVPSAPPPPPPAIQPPEPSAGPQPGGPKELVKKAQLRDVHVSVALMEEFLHYARRNTSSGIESCGILAGRLSANDSIFTITTLIIPKQTGTTDTVQVW